jgi:hypothetical protein
VYDLWFLGGVAAGAAWLASRRVVRRKAQASAADASGLSPVADLSHISPALQKTALWSLADGGFERRVVHGVLARGTHDVDVTAFDMETLRERRGEWAWLPVEPPFRIGPVVSVVACEMDRAFPHALFKHAGRGDEMHDDDHIERAGSVAKTVRDGLGMPRSYAAELPALPTTPLALALPEGWRAYSHAADAIAQLANGGFGAVLARAARRDLVIELIDSLVIVYPAARDVVGADAFADLTATALVVVDGVLAASPALTPRGVADQRPA